MKKLAKFLALIVAFAGMGVTVYAIAQSHHSKAKPEPTSVTIPKPEPKPEPEPVNRCLEALNKHEQRCSPRWIVLRAIGDVETTMTSNLNASNCILVNEPDLDDRSKCFKSKTRAIEAQKALSGWPLKTDNYDAGCWQTNFHWWGKYYEKKQDVFNPEENLRVANIVLDKAHAAVKDRARPTYETIARYHSQNPGPQSDYMAKARPAYNKYLNKCFGGER